MLENGQRVARIDTLIQLSGAMSVSPLDLVTGITWTPGGVQGGSFDFEDAARPRRPELN